MEVQNPAAHVHLSQPKLVALLYEQSFSLINVTQSLIKPITQKLTRYGRKKNKLYKLPESVVSGDKVRIE
jgi:hypothetical protein